MSVGLAGHRAAGSESGGPQAIFLLVLVPFALVIFFFRLGSYSLVNGDEAFYQAVAESVLPQLDGCNLPGRRSWGKRPRDRS